MSDSTGSGRDVVEQLAESFQARLRRGERPSLEEYVARCPERADDIRELFPALVEMEQLKPLAEAVAGLVEPTPTPAASPAAPVSHHPQRLGDYQILRVIGEGGMGVVYEAEHESLKNRVALKVMHPRFRSDPTYLRRFHTEARSAARLHHTNIVPVFDYGEHYGICYYAMPLIAGIGLHQVLEDVRRLRATDDPKDAREANGQAEQTATEPVAETLRAVTHGLLTGRFSTGPATPDGIEPAPTLPVDDGSRDATSGNGGPVEVEVSALSGSDSRTGSHTMAGQSESVYHKEITRLASQVADALDYAHRQGVVHRDIKPSNLLLDARGNVWVTDFGLAKFVEGDDLSQSHDLVGTLRFMAPERFRGVTDRRSDIYALGAALYELLTLRPAFAERDQVQLIHQIAHQAPAPLRQHDRRIPRDLETIVLKVLSKEPKDRCERAGELRDELRRFLEGRPTRWRRVGPVEQFRRWCRRNPVVASLTAALFLLFTAALAAVTWQWRVADRERVKAEAVSAFLRDTFVELSPEVTKGAAFTVDKMLDMAAKRADKAFRVPPQPAVEASIRRVLGTTYGGLGLFEKADVQLRRAITIDREVLGPEHEETLAAITDLTPVRGNQFKWFEPDLDLRAHYETCRRVLGPEHRVTLNVMRELAWFERNGRGRLDVGLALVRELVATRRRVLGPKHKETLESMLILAWFLEADNRYDEFEATTRELLPLQYEVLGEEHWQTLDSMQNLARQLVRRGKLKKAEELCRKALAIQLRDFGPRSKGTFEYQGYLINILRWQGKWKDAEALARETWQGEREALGPTSSQTVGSLTRLAAVLADQGKDPEAEARYREALQLRLKIHPPGHRDIAFAQFALGLFLLENRRDARQALPHLREAFETLRKVLAADDESIGDIKIWLGAALLDLGQAQEAKDMISEGMDIIRRAQPAGNSEEGHAECLLGRCLADLGQYPQAEPHLLKGYRLLQDDAGVPPLRRRLAYDWIVRLYEHWGRPDEAARWRRDHPNLPAQYSTELDPFQAEAQVLLDGPPLELPADVFAPEPPSRP